MNSQLSYRMAQLHQRDLYRQGERARAARAVSRDGRFTALCRRVMNGRFSGPQPQPRPSRPVARISGV